MTWLFWLAFAAALGCIGLYVWAMDWWAETAYRLVARFGDPDHDGAHLMLWLGVVMTPLVVVAVLVLEALTP